MNIREKGQPVILLAEDSEDDAYFFERALRKAWVGCSLLRAVNGKQAIEILGSSTGSARPSPCLIFLDLKMPVMSGFDVLEWLRFSGLDPVPKVIVLSGSNDEDDRARALSLGAAEYLVKPITADNLRERIQEDLILAGSAQGIQATKAKARAAL